MSKNISGLINSFQHFNQIDYLIANAPGSLPHDLIKKLGIDVSNKELVRKYLNTCHPEDIYKLFIYEKNRQMNCYEEQVKNLIFNQPQCNADYTYCAKLPFITIDEAAFYTLGKDPRIVKWEKIKLYQSLLTKEFIDLRELIIRAVRNGQLSDPIIPCEYLAWLKNVKITIPKEWIKEVEILGIQIKDWQSLEKKMTLILAEKDNLIDTLQRQMHHLKSDSIKNHQEISPRSEETYLKILRVILDALFDVTPGRKKISCFTNQSALITYLVDNIPSVRGISKTTLEEKFAKANKIELKK